MSDQEDNCNDIYNDEYYMYDENDLGNNNIIVSSEEIEFLEEREIIKEREKVIEEAVEKLFLQRDDAILAMIYLEWQTNKIERWYDSAEEYKFKAGIQLSEKTKEKLKQDGIESNGGNCLVCFEEKNESFFSLNCGHQFCADCWKEYLKEKIKSPLSALQAKCPQNGCTCVVYEKIYSKYLKDDPQSLAKLDKAISKNYINRNNDIKQCPNEKCKYYAKSSVHSFSQEVNCPCGTSYCFQCLKESHRPCTCELVNKFIGLNRNVSLDDYDKRWIEANTKECPNCHQKIQKSQGCNYMLCDKRAGGCGKAFCYVCETDWELHSNDHFNCNKYTEAVKQKEKNAKKIQQDLDYELKKYERYDFYYPRYSNYKNSIEVCKTKFKADLNEKVQLLIFIQELPTIETKFIFDALDTIINAKRTLEYSYIFGYYMKDSNNKKLFEHSQGILEYNTENLHKLILDSNLNFYIELEKGDFLKYFPEYKQSVSQKVIIINKYRQNLLEEIENKYIDDLDSYIINLKFK